MADGQRLKHQGQDLGLVVLQTPGHTPDSLALYDERERWLYVGDTLYARVHAMPWGETQDVPIILVAQSHWGDYVASLRKLRDFVGGQEKGHAGKAVTLSSGHTTSGVNAKSFVAECIAFIGRIVAGDVPVIAELAGDEVAPGGTLGDEIFVFWQEDGDPLFSFLAPKRFTQEF